VEKEKFPFDDEFLLSVAICVKERMH